MNKKRRWKWRYWWSYPIQGYTHGAVYRLLRTIRVIVVGPIASDSSTPDPVTPFSLPSHFSGKSAPEEVSRYLLPSENIVLWVRPHPAMMINPLSFLIIDSVAAGFITAGVLFDSKAIALGAVWTIFVVLLFYLLQNRAERLVIFFVLSNYRMIFVTGPDVQQHDSDPVLANCQNEISAFNSRPFDPLRFACL